MSKKKVKLNSTSPVLLPNQTISQQISGLENYRRFKTTQDHTSCDWYINHLQLNIIKKLEESDPSDIHWFTGMLKHDLLCMLGQLKNQLKRHCIMRLGETYTHPSDVNLTVIKEPSDWIPPEEALPFTDKTLIQIDEEVEKEMTEGQKILKEDFKNGCHILQSEFSKLLVQFYKKPITQEMAVRIAPCILLDYRMDLIKFIKKN